MIVYLTQYLCPKRHCIIAAAWQDDQSTEADTIAVLKARMAELKVDPWCGLCQSRDLQFETTPTKFPSLTFAMPFLKSAELSNLATRMRILRGN